jgi:phage tail sheath protein FI
MAVSESPAITIKEIDLSGYVPNVGSTWGAFVGDFGWGPVETAEVVSDESQLVAKFGSPTKANAEDFYTAAYFLKYASTMYVTRMVTDVAKNAHNGGSTAPLVKNLDHFEEQLSALTTDGAGIIAKWPGILGNSLKVGIVGAAQYTGWDYEDEFIGAPGTSAWATASGVDNDEVHVVVVDAVGVITGTKGAVLETFPFVSLAQNAKAAGGGSNYILDVINKGSNYVWITEAGLPAGGAKIGEVAVSGDDLATTAEVDASLTGGVDSADLTTSEFQTGYNIYGDGENIQVDFLIAPGMATSANQYGIINSLIAIAESRKDCVVVASPARGDVINNTTPNADVITTFGSTTYTSYAFLDNNYLKVYDRYNDQYIWIPASSSTAGLMAASDNATAPWYSPAGQRRGVYLGVAKLAYTPNKTERDLLYRNSINPVANIPGQGILLYGDKTHMARPSAFDRINVRRLFIVMERAISIAARNVLFEFNDEFTRAEFVNVVEPYLRDIQGRRGITDFRVIADETNNTPTVIDRNEFICSIFIKPARSINFVTLNFVAVRTGVVFEEVIGAV